MVTYIARAFANLSAVLLVNNSLSGRVAVLLLGLVTHCRESWLQKEVAILLLNVYTIRMCI